jgi:hypothetical protein
MQTILQKLFPIKMKPVVEISVRLKAARLQEVEVTIPQPTVELHEYFPQEESL